MKSYDVRYPVQRNSVQWAGEVANRDTGEVVFQAIGVSEHKALDALRELMVALTRAGNDLQLANSHKWSVQDTVSITK